MKFCSLGSFCYSAQVLRRNNIRDESNPFDWLFSSVKMVKHCIEDDFNAFLDKSYYYSVNPAEGSDEKRCQHSLYESDDNYPVFNHHDPLTIDEHHKHFVRSVDRFRKTLQSTEKKVFLYINRSKDNRNLEELLIESLLFTNFLDKHVNNYTLITIGQSLGELNHRIIKGNNLVFIQFSCSLNTGLEHENTSHDQYLDNIFKQVIDDIR